MNKDSLRDGKNRRKARLDIKKKFEERSASSQPHREALSTLCTLFKATAMSSMVVGFCVL